MGVAIVLTRMLVRRRGVRRLVLVLAVVMALLVGADRIFLGRAQRLRRDRGLPARRRDGARSGWRSTTRPRGRSRWSTRRWPMRVPNAAQEARRHPQPDQDRRRRPVPRRWSRRWPRDSGFASVVVVGDHGRGHRLRDGARGRRQRLRPRRSRSAATAPSARSARSSPAPASPSGSSPPAPATCWPATSTSRSTCARRSTSRSTARTGRSTWSRSAATRWRTPPSW